MSLLQNELLAVIRHLRESGNPELFDFSEA